MSDKILIVEDEIALARTLRDRLRKEGYDVEVTNDGNSGLESARKNSPALIVLDLMLPGIDGLALCQKLREENVKTPVLMLTAKRQTADKVTGLKSGADDYLTKPFQMAELLARIEALLRRAKPEEELSESVYQIGGLRVDLPGADISRDGEKIDLPAMEFRLLKYFLEHRGEVISRGQLLHDVWGYDAALSSRTVDVHIAWLRQKIEKDAKNPELIRTVVGLGYKFAG